MHVAQPYEHLFPGVDSAVLRVLASSNVPRSTREIARMAGKTHPAVGRVLERYELNGLVRSRRSAASFQYTFNRDHVAADAIIRLANLRSELFDRMRDAVGSWKYKPVHASVFGSAARGDGDEHSDIDVLIVRPSSVDEDEEGWREQLNQFETDIADWTGNFAGIAEVTEEDLLGAKRRNAAILKELAIDAVDLYGMTVHRLLAQTR